MGLKTNLALGVAAIAAAATSYAVPTSVEAADYYKGKTLSVIVGRGPGSGADSTARAFARYWAKYIPGNPKIIVRNMKGTPTYNFIYQKAKPDGLTITFTPYDPVSQLTKRKGFKADYSKMPFVGSLYNAALIYITTDQIKDPYDLKGIKGAKYGGQSPTGRFDLLGRFTMEILGADFRYLTGFGGAKKVLNAMRRREVDIQTIGLNLYRLSAEKPLVKTGKAVPLYYMPFPGHTGLAGSFFGGLPSFEDYYKKVHGKGPSGEQWEVFQWATSALNAMSYSAFLPPNTPNAQRDILRAAYAKVVKDPKYLAEQKKMFGYNLPYVNPALGAKIVGNMLSASQANKDYLSAWIKKGAKARIKKKKKKK
jgi:tripartite-type tricarboxylate transporter receptor subunit TctC